MFQTILHYFSTTDHQVAFLATFFSTYAAYLFTEKSNKGPWVGVIAEIFWILWIAITGKWEVFPIEFTAFLIYMRGCYRQVCRYHL
jgi:hypothetical protein